MQPTPIFLPRKFHRQRSLSGYSPWGRKRDGLNWVSTPEHRPGLLKLRALESPKSGVPILQGRMPDALRGSWCNNNRNKVHNKCYELKSSPNHPSLQVHGKIVFHETSLGAKKIGDCWPVPKGLVPKQLVRPHPWVSTLLGLGESPRIYNSNKFPGCYWSGGHILRTADPEREIKFQMIWGEMRPLTPARLQRQKMGVFLPHLCARGPPVSPGKSSSISFAVIEYLLIILAGLPWWLSGKEPTSQCRRHGF